MRTLSPLRFLVLLASLAALPLSLQAGTVDLSAVAATSVGSGVAPNTFYKSNNGGAEEGPFTSLFSTVFTPPGDDATTAKITYLGVVPVLITEAWVKGGTNVAYFSGFSWDGTGELILSNAALPNVGNSGKPPGISHVAIRGTFPQDNVTVADSGSSLLLAALAIVGLAARGRRC